MDFVTGSVCNLESSFASVETVFPTTASITNWLREQAVWPVGCVLESTRLNRLWVGRDGRFTFELTLALSVEGRTEVYPLQGGFGRSPDEATPSTVARFSSIGLLGLRIENPSLQLWCLSPDRDSELPLIERLCANQDENQWLLDTKAGNVLGLNGIHSDSPWPIRVTVASYRIGKRCALRFRRKDQADRPGVFIKVFRRFPTAEQRLVVNSLARQLPDASQGFLRVPEILDVWEREKALVFREVATSASPLGHSSDDAHLAGETLAILHSIPLDPAARSHSPVDEWHTVARWIRGLSFVQADPKLQESFAELLQQLKQRASLISGDAYITVHRDYYASQLLRQDSTIWMVDFDTLGCGHPEVDMATFMAHLVLDECRAGNPCDSLKSAGFFVRSYLSRGGNFDWSRMQFYFACALCRLGAIHLARGLQENIVKKLWMMAKGLLQDEQSIKDAVSI
ncbi:MAG: aminoglycoside phosphotransferase family protein [Planctomycetota bacterium]